MPFYFSWAVLFLFIILQCKQIKTGKIRLVWLSARAVACSSAVGFRVARTQTGFSVFSLFAYGRKTHAPFAFVDRSPRKLCSSAEIKAADEERGGGQGALALGAHGSIMAKRVEAWQCNSQLPASLCLGNSSSTQSCGSRMCVTLRCKHFGSPRGYPLTARGLGWMSGGRNRGAQ